MINKKITLKYFKSKHYRPKNQNYIISRDYKNNCLIIQSWNNYPLDNYNTNLFNYNTEKISNYGYKYKTVVTLK